MTKRLDKAFDAVRKLPPAARDDIARMLLSPSGDAEPYRLTDEERAAIARSKEEAARGEFVSDRAMREFWKKLGL